MERSDFLVKVGRNIKTRREEKGISQAELAKMCGYKANGSRSTIACIERGTSDIPASKITLFAKALDCTPTELMFSDIVKKNDVLEIVDCLNEDGVKRLMDYAEELMKIYRK